MNTKKQKDEKKDGYYNQLWIHIKLATIRDSSFSKEEVQCSYYNGN